MNSNLLQKLSDATPKSNIIQWFLITALYSLTILLNEHFEIIQQIGLPKQTEALLKCIGVFLYIGLTLYQFQNTHTNEIYSDAAAIKLAAKNSDEYQHFPVTKGNKKYPQGNRPHQPKPNFLDAGAAKNTFK